MSASLQQGCRPPADGASSRMEQGLAKMFLFLSLFSPNQVPENLSPYEAYIICTVKYRSMKQSLSNRHFKDNWR